MKYTTTVLLLSLFFLVGCVKPGIPDGFLGYELTGQSTEHELGAFFKDYNYLNEENGRSIYVAIMEPENLNSEEYILMWKNAKKAGKLDANALHLMEPCGEDIVLVVYSDKNSPEIQNDAEKFMQQLRKNCKAIVR